MCSSGRKSDLRLLHPILQGQSPWVEEHGRKEVSLLQEAFDRDIGGEG